MMTIARAARPSRTTLIVAGLAALAAVGMHGLAWMIGHTGLSAARLAGYAATFEVMPIWVVIGNVMYQVGAAIDTRIKAEQQPAAKPHDGWNDDERRAA